MAEWENFIQAWERFRNVLLEKITQAKTEKDVEKLQKILRIVDGVIPSIRDVKKAMESEWKKHLFYGEYKVWYKTLGRFRSSYHKFAVNAYRFVDGLLTYLQNTKRNLNKEIKKLGGPETVTAKEEGKAITPEKMDERLQELKNLQRQTEDCVRIMLGLFASIESKLK